MTLRLLLFAAVSFSVLCGCTKPEPTDTALTQTFSAKKQVFDELREMISSDHKIGRVGDDVVGDVWFSVDNISINSALESSGLARDRYANYLKLLRSIGAYRVTTSGGTDVIIHMYRNGTLVEGRTVDNVFQKTTPDPIVDDTMVATAMDNTFAYRALGSSWYIRREHD